MMNKFEAISLNVDSLPRRGLKGAALDFSETPCCFEIEPAVAYRRWRPAVLAGEHAADFVPEFFQPPAHVPWSGFITAADALVLNNGLAIAARAVLMGDSIALPTESFLKEIEALQTSQHQAGTSRAEGRFSIEAHQQDLNLPAICCNLALAHSDSYWHWMVDVLPRLHKASSHGSDVGHYLFAGEENAWKGQLLEAAGHDGRKDLYIGDGQQAIKAERLVIPTFDRCGSEIRPSLLDVHKLVAGRLASEQLAAPANRRLYLENSRDEASTLSNAVEIRKAFQDQGFEVPSPELSFAERVRLLAQASIVVGHTDSSLVDTVYCRPKTRICAMQSAASRNFLQAQIAMFAQHDIFYLVGTPHGQSEYWSVDVFQARRLAKLLIS